MKITIIVDDKTVYIDSVSYANLDLSSIPTNVHAMQFNGNAGWIEFKDNNDGTKPHNEPISSLPVWATTAISKWQEAKDLVESKKIAQEAFKATHILATPQQPNV